MSFSLTSLVAQTVRRLPAMQETRVQSLGREGPLEKKVATHSSIAWRIPWREEPGWLQSMGSKRVGLSDFTFTFLQMDCLRGRGGAVLGLCYSTWASLVVACGLSCPAGCEILVHQGLKPRLGIRRWILTTGPRGQSLDCFRKVFRCMVTSVTLRHTPEVLLLLFFPPPTPVSHMLD